MKNSRKEKSLRTKRVAVSGMMVALGVIILYMGSLIEVLDISMAAIASILCIIAVIEYGKIYAIMVFGATAILAMLVLPEKYTPSLYALLIGYYPILKELIERIGKKSIFSQRGFSVLRWAIKLVFFNCALLVFALVAKYILLLPEAEKWMQITMFVLANAVFVVYDIALTRLISTYIFTVRSRLRLPGGRM
jgi:hypothetical protein